MPESTAVVPTDAAERYAKQLLSHLGHKATVEELAGHPKGGRLLLSAGVGDVEPGPGNLVLRASADDEESLARVQDVLGRHLERFGAKRELIVTWERVS